MKFEIDRLEEYSDEALLSELRRVCAIAGDGPLTQASFAKYANVSTSTLTRRFGSWKDALMKAGLVHKYSGRPVSFKLQAQQAKLMSDDELLSELRRVASVLSKSTMTGKEFDDNSPTASHSVYRRRFGSWSKALKRANLDVAPLSRRYTDEECFENLLRMWTHFGRPPKYDEMSCPPSIVGVKAYLQRWGTWRKALFAFVDRANSDAGGFSSEPISISGETNSTPTSPRRFLQDEVRDIRLGLRYHVLKRDSFRCVICGASPATMSGCELHVDHIIPWSKGGKTVIDNLRTLCKSCNLGKGVRLE